MKDKLTPADIDANIVHTEIVKHVSKSGQVLRWAVLTTRNGFAVSGRPSASVSSANDDPAIGESVAIENAKHELWPLMGYELKSKLAVSGACTCGPDAGCPICTGSTNPEAADNDFPLGKACDLSGEGTCEACQ